MFIIRIISVISGSKSGCKMMNGLKDETYLSILLKSFNPDSESLFRMIA